MIRLLSSHFMRLKKDLVFWACVIVMFLFGSAGSMIVYFDKLDLGALDSASAENVAFGYDIAAGLLCLAFCCLFQGEEYADGTIRNKIIAGHARVSIYLSQALISMFAGAVMCIAYIVPSLLIGTIFLGGFKELNTGEIAWYYLNGFLLMAVCVALYSFIAVAIQKKTACTAACFLVVCLMVYAAISVHDLLRIPEYTYMFRGGEMTYGLNPRYPDPQERQILELLFDVLLPGQAYQLYFRYAENIPFMAVSNVILLTVLLFAGVMKFRHKDLK